MMTSAKIVADTENLWGARITTFEVVAPRYLLAEINTHRVIARSAASSRAIPVMKRVDMVRTAPYVPEAFGKNRPGMQSDEEVSPEDSDKARAIWLGAANSAALYAEELHTLGVHKQQANRLLEPFVYYSGVMTATELDNFWELRDHADADPGFQLLARHMRKAYDSSKPRKASHHLPYTDDLFEGTPLSTMFLVSAARCARVSYNTFDGLRSTPDKDLKLCSTLISSGHMSPFDHPAISDTVRIHDRESGLLTWQNPGAQRQYWGWIPYRTQMEDKPARRDSYAPFHGYPAAIRY